MDCRTTLVQGTSGSADANQDKQDVMIENSIRQSVRKQVWVEGTVSAHQVANRLREQGVEPSTISVTWHNNMSDLVALKQGPESEGEHGMLTDDSNCILVLRYLQPNFEIIRNRRWTAVPAVNGED